MVTKVEIRENWGKVEKQVKKAEESLKNNEIDDCVYFVWLASENLMNTLKTIVNGRFTVSHKRKVFDAKRYFLKGVLKRDYSKTVKKLSQLRLVAAFEPYTIVKKSYTKDDANQFLENIKHLKNEVETKLRSERVL